MIKYRNGTKSIDWMQLCQLYFEVGLLAGFGKKKNADKIIQAFKKSERVVTAWNNEKIVGAGRMITDGVCYGCIFDVGVLPEHQKKGIGKGIMTHLLKSSDHLSVQLWPTKGNIKFYEKLGFIALGPEHPIMIRKRYR